MAVNHTTYGVPLIVSQLRRGATLGLRFKFRLQGGRMNPGTKW
jgi:hypothetical protein